MSRTFDFEGGEEETDDVDEAAEYALKSDGVGDGVRDDDDVADEDVDD